MKAAVLEYKPRVLRQSCNSGMRRGVGTVPGRTQAKMEASDTVDSFESMDDNTQSIVQLKLEM